ncbi:MAG TPA: type II toxin-antitoxin system RnlB family antitoxin, partial [Clostridia bacterium]|nr:type II toxin-antitoxin system RnlB family antitoxin [Clostridia bacterium]
FHIIITLLDYEMKISDVLKSIKVSSLENKRILIDTALVSGINKYRFIECKINTDGTVDLSDYKYIDINSNILKIANNIIRKEPIKLNNSILTVPQIDYIKGLLSYNN